MAILHRVKNSVIATLISARPNTWLRIWGEMIVAAVLATQGHFDFISFIKGFIAASPLLWTAAYMLNDLTDIKLDKQHEVRKGRPVTAALIGKRTVISIITALITGALLLGLSINRTFFSLLLLLLGSQLLYTLPPIRLKERFFFDIFLNGINSVIRFLLGWYSQTATFASFHLSPLLFLLSIKLVFFIGHRMQNRKLEIANHIQSTIAILKESQLYLLIAVFSFISILSYLYSIYAGIVPTTSFVAWIIGLAVYVLLARKVTLNELFSPERNLNFRNFLYIEYFLITNIIAITILIS